MSDISPLRRKLSIAAWSAPSEGNILGKIELDVTEALRFIDKEREEHGVKVTITHMIGKATANALDKVPTLNGKILFGKFVPFDSVDITFLVALDNGRDLAKAKVCNAEDKSVCQIAEELQAAAKRLDEGKDDAFEKSKGALRMLPTWLLRPLLKITGWFSGALGVNVPALGLERHAFGSCMITSVGMMGFDEGYAPFTPFARVPLLLLVGAIREVPAVHEGEIKIRKKMIVSATVDHRFIDGSQLGTLAKAFRAVIETPFETLCDNKKAAPKSDSIIANVNA